VFNPAKDVIKKMKEKEALMGNSDSEEPANEQEQSEEN
jgi:hypothetical protein